MKLKSAAVVFGVLVLTGSQMFASSQPYGNGHQRQNGEPLPNIKFDKTPLSRDVAAGTSFAPIIRKVGPSVVTVYSTKTVRESSSRIPLDDPFLRRFFGDEDDSPRRPRDRERPTQAVHALAVSDLASARVARTKHTQASALQIHPDHFFGCQQPVVPAERAAAR